MDDENSFSQDLEETLNINYSGEDDSRWNKKQEDYLKNLKKSCDQLYKYFNQSYFDNKYYLYFFKIPIIVLGSFNGLSSVGLQDFVKQEYISLTNAIISVGISIISSIELFIGLSTDMNASKTSAAAFKRLSLDIGKELSVPRKEREFTGIVFLNQCYSRYVEILGNSIAIKKSFKKDYLSLEKVKQLTSSVNNQASDEEIESKTDESEEKSVSYLPKCMRVRIEEENIKDIENKYK